RLAAIPALAPPKPADRSEAQVVDVDRRPRHEYELPERTPGEEDGCARFDRPLNDAPVLREIDELERECQWEGDKPHHAAALGHAGMENEGKNRIPGRLHSGSGRDLALRLHSPAYEKESPSEKGYLKENGPQHDDADLAPFAALADRIVGRSEAHAGHIQVRVLPVPDGGGAFCAGHEDRRVETAWMDGHFLRGPRVSEANGVRLSAPPVADV